MPSTIYLMLRSASQERVSKQRIALMQPYSGYLSTFATVPHRRGGVHSAAAPALTLGRPRPRNRRRAARIAIGGRAGFAKGPPGAKWPPETRRWKRRIGPAAGRKAG